jgi:hypothetical protein
MTDNAVYPFVLNGNRYKFSRFHVLEVVKNETPRRIDKYEVEIAGVKFPPKQVLELLTKVQSINFTTMDAQRILKKLGFNSTIAVQTSAGYSTEDHTVSEQVFEHYLGTNGYTLFEFQPNLAESARKPDYCLTVGSKQIRFEVKEFRASEQDFTRSLQINGVGGGAYDPYLRIRQKIDDAREQFKGIKNEACCLVLFNQEKPLVDLNWQIVYGAMLGPIGVSIPFNPATETFDRSGARDVFGGNGKCGPRSNTTISAVAILEPLLLGERRFRC